ncbi:hypothetical protein C3B59_05685 [Cryobacterium zongtaii]|uniref:Uncharacterized protein n=1 Tax=Cryobacterium zongtaii TaxID=1259217 RepID=A0A2S3ZLP7_9MICO|nr:hypothetical protein [Cryobacterium zongtaii]POH69380.1 hypothetical protein C3B59_05685 [Cryobacterium zongtaii]
MDTSYTYSSRDLIRVTVYAPADLTPPASMPMTRDDGTTVNVLRISDLSLECDQCKSRDCHRRELHKCQCGRHVAPRFAKAES